jgi:hypothetical protein
MLNDAQRRKDGIAKLGSGIRTIQTPIAQNCHPRTRAIGGSNSTMKQNDFRKSGMVSIWIGNFNSDRELDDYLDLSRRFEEDFGFELNERDPPETVVNNAPTAILQLAKGFSWSKSYEEPVAELARKQGIEQATTMVVFLNVEYQPKGAKAKENTPLKFLGAVPFS